MADVRLSAWVSVIVSYFAARPAFSAEHIYTPPGASYRYSVRLAPLPAEEFGAAALDLFDYQWRARQGLPPKVPSADLSFATRGLGDPPLFALPATDDSSWLGPAPTPLGARLELAATYIGDPERERVAALYVRRPFLVGSELSRVKLLRLRVRYRDGLAVYVNGVEVARRNLEPGSAPNAPALRSHGTEWETFYVPVLPGLLFVGENLLALEVRPSLMRLMPLLDLELVGSEQVQIVRGPLVQRVGPTSATLVFETDLPTPSEIRFRAANAGSERRGVVTGGIARYHALTLVDLPAHGQVTYTVSLPERTLPERTFHTAPPPGDVIRFVVYGDVRSGHDTHAELLPAILAESPDFVLCTGDMVVRGTDEADWQRYFSVAAEMLAEVPVYPVIGNHDVGQAGDLGRLFADFFALWPGPPQRPPGAAWYSFDVADLHIVMLDSNQYGDDRQLLWLERDLADARQRGVRAMFAVTHHGPSSRGPHGGEPVAQLKYAPVLASQGVAVLFSGHDHLYQRGQMRGLAYIVSGGGGAPLYEPRCGSLGKRACREKDGAQAVYSEHHYVAVEVYPEFLTLCPRRSDRTLLEPCTTIPLVTSARDPAARVPLRPSAPP